MSKAGALWVMTLVEMRSAPVERVAADGLERHAARHLDDRAAFDERDALRDVLGRHVVEHHEVGAAVDGFDDLLASARTRLRRCVRATAPGRDGRPR